MPEAKVGQRVQVDISGLNTPGISIGGGVSASGVIIGINVALRQITVRLDVAFNGNDVVIVSPERFSVVE